MSPNVTSVTAWNPHALRATAVELDDLVDRLDDRMKGLLNDQDALAERWKGDAANAAALRVVQERSLGSAIAGALLQIADAYRTTAGVVEGAQMHVLTLVRAAEHQSFTVHDNGIVDAADQISLLRALLPPGATYDTASLQLERQAAELSVALVDSLQQAAAAADDATARTHAAIVALEDAAEAATPGKVIKSANGKFSWVPDVPATVAASTIGLMSDATKEGLKSAALSTGDDLGRGIARGLGPYAAILGTVPAINNDIEGGMDPTKAVVTESAGAAVGFAAGTYAGTKLGGLIGTAVAPGVGTAAGLLIGAAVGGFFTWGVSKGSQAAWN
ncbi:hypothetical protein [Rhodococcus sp. SJ-2]